MAYTLGGVNLGIVQSERSESNNEIMPIIKPEEDSDEAETIPILGAHRLVTVMGIKQGDLGELQSFAIQLNQWVEDHGKVANPVIDYASDLIGTISVKVQGANFSWDAGNKNHLGYEIRLIQSI